MAKSNMRSVRMRRVNRALHVQDRTRQKKERASEQRSIRSAYIRRNSIPGRIRRFFSGIKQWFNRRNHFGLRNLDVRRRSAFKTLRNLDLRTVFDLERGAGARQLREWWPGLGGMVSTRDGRRV